MLVAHTVARAMNLAAIVCPEPTHMRFYDAYGIRVGGVWLDPTGSGNSLVWRDPWPPDITTALISDTNPKGTQTKYELDIAALVLHKATLPEA